MLTNSLPPKRSLNDQFMDSLKQGILFPPLRWVQKDPSLDLQIRQDAINLYYRGGSLLKVIQDGAGYRCEFNPGYENGVVELEQQLDFSMPRPRVPLRFDEKAEVLAWITEALPHQKILMDVHDKTRGEREAQQHIVRTNNYGDEANGTDWYIVDMELAEAGDVSDTGRTCLRKPDLLGLHWPSKGASRKHGRELGWALIEVKQGLDALGGTAGLHKHLRDMISMADDAEWVERMRWQVESSLRQRRELGLVPELKNDPDSITNQKPRIIYLLVDIDPAGSKLPTWLDELLADAELRDRPEFFLASPMGLALHDEYLLGASELRDHLLQGKLRGQS